MQRNNSAGTRTPVVSRNIAGAANERSVIISAGNSAITSGSLAADKGSASHALADELTSGRKSAGIVSREPKSSDGSAAMLDGAKRRPR